MIGHSCADLETVLNEAVLYAGYQRAEHITMEHVLKACLHTVFDRTSAGDEQDDFCSHLSDPHHIASHFIYHEAGHAVVSEVLCPGSVTLVFAGNLRQEEGGFTRDYREPGSSLLEWRKKRIITSLGGMAAMEQKFGIRMLAVGEDLNFAFYKVWGLISRTCINGFSFYAQGQNDSERLKADVDQAVATHVEQYYRKAKEIISANWDFSKNWLRPWRKRNCCPLWISRRSGRNAGLYLWQFDCYCDRKISPQHQTSTFLFLTCRRNRATQPLPRSLCAVSTSTPKPRAEVQVLLPLPKSQVSASAAPDFFVSVRNVLATRHGCAPRGACRGALVAGGDRPAPTSRQARQARPTIFL